MVITESDLREMWRDGKGVIPVFPPNARFTPSAKDFLKSLPVQFQPVEMDVTWMDPLLIPVWDKAAIFPVVQDGALPVCDACGHELRNKPEHMTQLDAGHYASKANPRIRFRGRIDSLNALCMLLASQARQVSRPALAVCLDTLAAYCRELMSADYNNRPVLPLVVNRLSAEELHNISHHPETYLGMDHIIPGPQDPAILHWLNFLRTQIREVELLALEVYPPPHRADLVNALNRFSSAVYVLELLIQNGSVI